MTDPLRNPKDPLHNQAEAAKELFRQFEQLAEQGGFSVDDVQRAAANVLMNAIRERYVTRTTALAAFDELTTKMRHLLAENHYDLTGKRRNVFPYTQHVDVAYLGKLDKPKH